MHHTGENYFCIFLVSPGFCFVRHTSCRETDVCFTAHQVCFCTRHVVSTNRCTCPDEALNAYLTMQSFCSFSVTKPSCNIETTSSSSSLSANKQNRNSKNTSVSSCWAWAQIIPNAMKAMHLSHMLLNLFVSLNPVTMREHVLSMKGAANSFFKILWSTAFTPTFVRGCELVGCQLRSLRQCDTESAWPRRACIQLYQLI